MSESSPASNDPGAPVAVLPLRDIVVFPGMVAPLFVGREKSVRALEHVAKTQSQILLVTQKNAGDDDPSADDLFTVGTLANVLQLLKLPDNTVKVLVEGKGRARVTAFDQSDGFFAATIEPVEDDVARSSEAQAQMRLVQGLFDNYVKLSKKPMPEMPQAISQIEEPGAYADAIAAHIPVKLADKQTLLEEADVARRLEKLYALVEGEVGVMEVEKKIRSRVKRQMEKSQRDYYLNEQLKAIQRELGEGEEGRSEVDEIEERVRKTKLSKEARERAQAEIRKLRQMSPMSAEATVLRNYLDWLLSIPWNKRSKTKIDLKGAEGVLDEDHFGLEKVKERIVEYLAVQKRQGKLKGPILCLVGPPGVGKTSLGKSIARATGREFIRMSLGGVRDEAEIRGHRRTYIGSMPGKIIQGMKKAKTSNPLFLLDEIDKLGADFRGDPSSALLEVLDPEQNAAFNDHYLEVDYDLSDVMFITTANSLRMPQPLIDRMELIRIPGYTEDEKVEIVKRHILRKQAEAHGLKPEEFEVEDDALRGLIRYYTREAGVRNLEREIANLARKAVKQIVAGEAKSIRVTADNLGDYAGVRRHRYGEVEGEDQVGVVTGLAWTEVGGDTLTIEAVMLPGKGGMRTTGKLGEVMKESIEAARSWVRARSTAYGVEPPLFEKREIHVHVPEGATPKDGPSAGVAMATSIISVLTGIPVRRDIAMTGEITLRGRVLPIGGLKEKLLAALRAGIRTVLIPQENAKDLVEIPDTVKSGLEIIPVATMDEVIGQALTRKPEPIAWEEPAAPPPQAAGQTGEEAARAH